jgi:hypothetical protein
MKIEIMTPSHLDSVKGANLSLGKRDDLTNAYLAGLKQGVTWKYVIPQDEILLDSDNWVACAVCAGKQVEDLARSANNLHSAVIMEEKYQKACDGLEVIFRAERVLKQIKELETGEIPQLPVRWIGQRLADQKLFELAIKAFRRERAKVKRMEKAREDAEERRNERIQARERDKESREESWRRAEVRKHEAAALAARRETEAVQEKYDELIRALAYTSGGKVDPAQVIIKYRRAVDIQNGGDGTLRGAGGSGGGVMVPTPSGPELRFDGPPLLPTDPIFKQIG